MRIHAAASAAAVLLACVPQPSHAAGAGPGPGELCSLSTVTQPFTGEPNRMAAKVEGGPIVIADGDDPRAGRVVCTIQVGEFTHAGADAARVSSLTTPGVVYLPTTVVEFVAEPQEWLLLCTHVEIEGAGTFYWDTQADEWSTDGNVLCDDGISDPPDRSIFDVIFEDVVDPLLCPVLGSLSPGVEPVTITPEGDTYVAGELFWDCPPYNWSI